MNQFLLSALCLFIYMSILFIIALIKKNNAIADIGYGGGFIVVSLVSLIQNGGHIYATIPYLLVLLWGIRLAIRIGIRNHGKPEDFRYAAWRKEWKNFYLRSYLQIFMLQGLIIYVISAPVLMINLFPKTVNYWVFGLGILVWIVGYLFEVIGDYQLDEFLKLPMKPSRYMQSGLWSLTRHPNYFGEATMWTGIFIISLGASMYGVYAVIGPILITFLLTKVSGIPMVEKRWKDDAEWKKYAKKTPAFIPRLNSK